MFQPGKIDPDQGRKNRNFVTWPGLMAEIISKHLSKSEATTFGDFLLKAKNTRSTKSEHLALGLETYLFPPIEETTILVFAAIDLSNPETGKLFTDLTGLFPFTRYWGMQYMLIVYAYDDNAIFVEPIKLRIDLNILRACDVLYDTLETAGHVPKLNIMENEASISLKSFSQKSKTVVQLAPPHIHRQNASKHAIHTFKIHFVAVLALVENNFPISLWYLIVKQSKINLDILRISWTNPRLLEYAQCFGAFAFNTTPMAPSGKKVIAHEKPNQRVT